MVPLPRDQTPSAKNRHAFANQSHRQFRRLFLESLWKVLYVGRWDDLDLESYGHTIAELYPLEEAHRQPQPRYPEQYPTEEVVISLSRDGGEPGYVRLLEDYRGDWMMCWMHPRSLDAPTYCNDVKNDSNECMCI